MVDGCVGVERELQAGTIDEKRRQRRSRSPTGDADTSLMSALVLGRSVMPPEVDRGRHRHHSAQSTGATGRQAVAPSFTCCSRSTASMYSSTIPSTTSLVRRTEVARADDLADRVEVHVPGLLGVGVAAGDAVDGDHHLQRHAERLRVARAPPRPRSSRSSAGGTACR